MNIRTVGCLCFAAATLCAADDIDSIEHIIIFMQENRAFDHYYGKMAGVRGFNDRTAVLLESGYNSFYQPYDGDISEYFLPFNLNPDRTSTQCIRAPEMTYSGDLGIWNKGKVDSWNTARRPGYGMAYFNRENLPYYYALYDGFTMGDQYFQSILSDTMPNRLMMFSGSNGLSVSENPILTNVNHIYKHFDWETVAEVMQAHNVTWKVYQEVDNFDNNGFAWFSTFQNATNHNPLYRQGMSYSSGVLDALNDDIIHKKLPSVSFIVAPMTESEHAPYHPCVGEDFVSRLIDILRDEPKIYAKTVLILNYDEGGQFFDHHWNPTPPVNTPMDGLSTVSVEGEVNTDPSFVTEPSPIGLGFRVPLLVVSPWSRGHKVISQTMDHTSVLKLIESRFNITFSNISPWRRAISGNLLQALNFDEPADYSWPESFPETDICADRPSFLACFVSPPPLLPYEQCKTMQEEGTRISRALPYQFNIKDVIVNEKDASTILQLTIGNSGEAGAAFQLYNLLDMQKGIPRKYAVEAGKSLADSLIIAEDGNSLHGAVTSSGRYSFNLMGPNGFVRTFAGNSLALSDSHASCSSIQAYLSYQPSNGTVTIHLVNSDRHQSVALAIVDNAYGILDRTIVTVHRNSASNIVIKTTKSHNWYDLTVEAEIDQLSGHLHAVLTGTKKIKKRCFERRFMGHMENGVDSVSDPAMSEGLPGLMTMQPKLCEGLSFMTYMKIIASNLFGVTL